MSGTRHTEQLAQLHSEIRQCTACPLHRSRTQAVPGEGSCPAAVMLIGEGPGKHEDLTGKPFCGQAGRFLDKVLAKVGLKRAQLFITSSVKCRPPGNRNPRREELNTCREKWLFEQIRLVQATLIVLLGKTAAKAILNEDRPLQEVHGKVVEKDGRNLLVTYHPAAGMRFPDTAAKLEQDFAKIAEFIKKQE